MRNQVFSSFTRRAWRLACETARNAVNAECGTIDDLRASLNPPGSRGPPKPVPPEQAAAITSKREALMMARGISKLSRMVEDDAVSEAKLAKVEEVWMHPLHSPSGPHRY